MRDTGKVAIARVVIRSKEQLVALRPMGDVLGMATMIFADEVLPPDRLDELADVAEVKTTKRELDIAKQLVESLAGDFEPERYSDAYRQEVLSMIERKAEGKEIITPPAAQEPAPAAPDLMSALKASLDAVRERQGASARKRKPAAKAKRKAAAAPAEETRLPARRRRQAVGAARPRAPAAQVQGASGVTAPNATSPRRPSRRPPARGPRRAAGS